MNRRDFIRGSAGSSAAMSFGLLRRPKDMLRRIRAEKARRSLEEFVNQAWPVVEPGTPLIPNWHIGAICEHLQAVTDGEIRRLVINIGPGHSKSLIVSVFWPAWEWIGHPEIRSLFSSYGMDLAIRDSVRCRDVLASDWYRETFEPEWEFKGDQNVKSFFENDAKGFRLSLSVGSKGTGFRGNKVVVDDPLNAKDQYSKVARDECIRWWDKVMSSRLNDPRTGARVIIMQRLHEEDLSGHVLAAGGYEHLCLPSEFDPRRRSVTCLGWADPRTEPGELLFSGLFTAEVLAQARKDLGSDGYAGQHQQSPVASDGGVFKQGWFRYWSPESDGKFYRLGRSAGPVLVRAKDCRRFATVDLAFSTRTSADFTVIAAWAVTPDSDLVLLDLDRRRLEGPDIIPAVARMIEKHDLEYVGIEDVSAQLLVVQAAKRAGLTVRGLHADRDKRTRSIPATIRMEGEQVFFPRGAAYLGDLEGELLAFDKGAHDDCVDVLSYAAIEVQRYGGAPEPAQAQEARKRKAAEIEALRAAEEADERDRQDPFNSRWWGELR